MNGQTPAASLGRLRIGELARRSEVSIRNIREYQDRGLLPPPRHEGRAALYGEDHLVRLRLISRLLARGYTLAVIRDLLDAWAGGRDLHDVLGLEAVVARPWGDDTAATVSPSELDELFRGQLSETGRQQLVTAGVFVPEAKGFRCPQRRLLDVVPVLLDARIPGDASAAVLARARRHMDAVAADMVDLVLGALLPEGTPQGLPEGPELTGLAASVERLRGVADVAAAAMFAMAMQQALDSAVDLVTGRALQERTGP